MPLMKRDGVLGVSMRVKVTALGSPASALRVTKSRPRRVETHIVPRSLGALAIEAMYCPPRSPASPAVRSGPTGTKSPQVIAPSYSGTPPGPAQWASSCAWSPPLSFVRQRCWAPM
jgi:hypothetical protein